MSKGLTSSRTSLSNMFGYGLGECANSLVMNGFLSFAMLYYTEALKLNPALAGMAMALAVFWEAVTEPLMGHISDRTRSRFGRRHPWMLLGGIIMSLSFYYIWAVPESLPGASTALFWYLVVVNLALRTGLTMFFIPYVALGFELCADYEERARLQAVRQVLNMAANLAGPALAWTVFFRDQIMPDGTKVIGTSVPRNFVHMGAVFSLAVLAFVLVAAWLTRHRIEDTRTVINSGTTPRRENFWPGLGQILRDPNPRWVLVYIFLLCVGMVLVSSLQMYVYVYLMKFDPDEKTLAHGSTMIGMAVGAAISARLARRFDKKGAVLLGGMIGIGCNVMLAVLFLTGWVPAGTDFALALFVFFHATYWLGNGIMLPIATAMMADVAELHRHRTGVNKDGAYSAGFSLVMRLAIAVSLATAGWILVGIGFVADGKTAQSLAAIWRLGAATFMVTPLVCVAALLAIKRYPLTRESINRLMFKPKE